MRHGIKELKSLPNPQPIVVKTFDAMFILFGKNVENWISYRKFIGSSNFLESLDCFNKDSVTPDMVALLKPIMDDPNFNIDKVRSVSVAAGLVFNWISEIYQYALTRK